MKQTKTSAPSPQPLVADISFLLGYGVIYLVALALLRGMLLYRNSRLAEGIPLSDLAWAFLVGARFDLVIISATALPLVLALLLPNGLGRRRLVLLWLGFTGALTLFAGIVELDFYHEFHTRLNSITFQYLKEDPATVSSMIWHGFPVIRYLLLWLLLGSLYFGGLLLVDRFTRKREEKSSRLAIRIPVVILILFLVAWGARGTLRSGPPLRWGDAFHSPHLFANHLALNGTYTLVKAALATSKAKSSEQWRKVLPTAKALSISRQMLLTPQDELLDPEHYPLLRRHTPVTRLPEPPKNIVIIMMESFSGVFTGALGHDYGITPEFDKLAEQGLLFDRFFSNGTHTHQGMFATIACFPNLPGFEYLMQQPQGQNLFSGLPALLKPRGFNDIYVYNGNFAWDNQEGFFRNQGMTHFVGSKDYKNPKFIDPTWGVSDEDMFSRAIKELDRLNPNRPFFAVLQTLSNHTPYALPDPLPVEEVTGFEGLNTHLTAQRYSDWALGEFFAAAQKSPWFDKTLFVIVGDHGFGVRRQLSEIDLLRFHVPMLMIGPGMRESYGARNHTVATQIDIVPTVVSLLGQPFVHQCWGRNLLSLPEDDPGFGVIKPSGSDQTVALIRGDQILIKPPQGKAFLGRYNLYPDEHYQREDNEIIRDRLNRELAAFIQSAMQGLYENRVGL